MTPELVCHECGCKEFACVECGVPHQVKHKRSLPQHRRLFALVDAVYHHWPENSEVFKPKSRKHMRRWLTVQAGYFTALRTIRVKTTTPELAYQLLRVVLAESGDEETFIEIDGDQILRKKADSLSFEALNQADATKLFSEIDGVIEQYGMNAEQLLREASSAA